MDSQPKGAGPYEQPVQDNIKKAPKEGPDPEIHLQKRKDPLLCQNQSEVHETCQRDFHSSAMGGVSPMKGTVFLKRRDSQLQGNRWPKAEFQSI